jgi:hypothetical protein
MIDKDSFCLNAKAVQNPVQVPTNWRRYFSFVDISKKPSQSTMSMTLKSEDTGATTLPKILRVKAINGEKL